MLLSARPISLAIATPSSAARPSCSAWRIRSITAAGTLTPGTSLAMNSAFRTLSNGQRFMPLFIIGLIYLAAMFVIWLGFIVAILGVAGGAGLFSAISADPSQMMSALFRSIGATALVLVPLALVATALVAMAYWFAPLLVVLNGEEPIDALRKSFHACWINLGATSIYGLILIGLCIVAAIPLGLGFIVLAPVMAGSWYASWRETFDA